MINGAVARELYRTRRSGNRPGRPRKASLPGHCGDSQLEFSNTPDPAARGPRIPRIPPADLDRQRSRLEIPNPEFEAAQAKHFTELDEMIAMGWGDTKQTDIPADWRARRGNGTIWKDTPTEWRQSSWRRKNRKRNASNACDTLEPCQPLPSPSQAA